MSIHIKTILYDPQADDPMDENDILGTVNLELDWTENEVHLLFNPKDGARNYAIQLDENDQHLLKKWCEAVLCVLKTDKVNDVNK